MTVLNLPTNLVRLKLIQVDSDTHQLLMACTYVRRWSSDHQVQTVWLFTHHCPKKEAENCANGGIGYLSWTNLCSKHHFHCYRDTTLKISERNINATEDTGRKQVSSPQVCVIGPTWALTWLLNSVSATCWGGCMSLMLQKAATRDKCHWNRIQITSNRNTDDFCAPKCFSLGLSWLCFFNWLIIWNVDWLQLTFLSTWSHEFVTDIIPTQALTWLVNAVSATCWGSFGDLWNSGFHSQNSI